MLNYFIFFSFYLSKFFDPVFWSKFFGCTGTFCHVLPLYKFHCHERTFLSCHFLPLEKKTFEIPFTISPFYFFICEWFPAMWQDFEKKSQNVAISGFERENLHLGIPKITTGLRTFALVIAFYVGNFGIGFGDYSHSFVNGKCFYCFL